MGFKQTFLHYSFQVDLEGIELGRHGSISILSLYRPSEKRVYLIDVHKQGNEAFSTVSSHGTSLRMILESTVILKVLFDLRRDSDALFSLYGISLGGIRDVQLMELGTRKGSKDFLAGLGKCVKQDSTLSKAKKKRPGSLPKATLDDSSILLQEGDARHSMIAHSDRRLRVIVLEMSHYCQTSLRYITLS